MNKILLIDSNSILHRAYHAMPQFNNGNGQYTGAIYGYLNMLFKLIDDISPTHIVAVFDTNAKTFRHKMYAEYKGTRKPIDDELKMQFEPMKEILNLMHIKTVEKAGFEADDIIGTFAKKFTDDTIIVTGDKDSFQLVSPSTTIMWTKVGVTNVEKVDIKYLNDLGFKSTSQFIDYKALRGDSSDNIPGVKGVGEKTALELLEKYDSLDGIYAHADEISGKMGEKIRADKDMAYFSKELSTICQDVPLDYDLDDFKFDGSFDDGLAIKLEDFQMISILKRLNLEVKQKEVESVNLDENSLNEFLNCHHENLAIYLGDDFTLAIDSKREYKIDIKQDLFSNGLSIDEVFSYLKEAKIDKFIVYDMKKISLQFDFIPNSFYDVMIGEHLYKGSIMVKDVKDIFNRYNLKESAASLYEIYDTEMEEFDDFKDAYQLEEKLIPVLCDMEKCGIGVDKKVLDDLEEKYLKDLKELDIKIKEYAGKDINVSSPKQIATLLFDKLGLKHGKKNKSGYSVDESVLLSLRGVHPIIELILEYRKISKMLSTYVSGIKSAVKGDRVHTEFNQTITATGRLSSSNPNLQNIPVKGEEATLVKRAFKAREGCVFLSSDYSQIELRLLAHFSKDDKFMSAYYNGEDIHSSTASLVFGVPIGEVTTSQRKEAKAVNFGIVYGISDFGLSENLGISVYKAREHIENFFNNFPKVKEYLNSGVEFARENGYVITLSGRKRFLNDINTKNFNIRQQAERMAKNTPLQGSAADIVKMAMINIFNKLKGYKTKMLLQIHDELLFEVPLEEMDEIKQLVKYEMENVVKLNVPLEASVTVGSNWGDMK